MPMLTSLQRRLSANSCACAGWFACVLITLSFPAPPAQAQDQPVRVIAFGAHPDDCDLGAGGLAAKYAALGDKGEVRFANQRGCWASGATGRGTREAPPCRGAGSGTTHRHRIRGS